MATDRTYPENITDLIRSKKFLVVFGSVVALLSPLALISNSAGEHREEYLSISTLDANLKTESYFDGTNIVSSDERIEWNIKVSNGMKQSEYVSVRVKVLNSTDIIPNDITNTPSPNQELLDYRILVPKGTETTVPLDWSILDVEKNEDYLSVHSLQLNGEIKDNLDIRSLNGQNLKIVIELWKYDSDSGQFSFAWTANNKVNSVWNQVWFSLDS